MKIVVIILAALFLFLLVMAIIKDVKVSRQNKAENNKRNWSMHSRCVAFPSLCFHFANRLVDPGTTLWQKINNYHSFFTWWPLCI